MGQQQRTEPQRQPGGQLENALNAVHPPCKTPPSALIAFTMSVDDFVISYFTAGSSTSTLAMAIYRASLLSTVW